VLRRISGRKRENLTWSGEKLRNKDLYNLYCPPNIIRVIKSRTMWWIQLVAHMEEMRNVYHTSVGKTEGKISLGTSEHKLEDKVKTHLKKYVLKVSTECN
jgi:hypothetical protein